MSESRQAVRDFLRIQVIPTSIMAKQASDDINKGTTGFHESLLRSYHILDRVKRLLRDEVPHEYILVLIELMEGGNQ